MDAPATNRQIKVLRFYRVPLPEMFSVAQASWEIADLWANEENRLSWEKYVFLTGDVDDDSSDLRPYDPAALRSVILPDGWVSSAAVHQHREALAASLLENDAPYDRPEPAVFFGNKLFVFTGRFEFGSRNNCEQSILERHGRVADSVSTAYRTDYLVIGAKGSQHWKHGRYGSKIEQAVLQRRQHRQPAIISESHWRKYL